MILEEQEKGVIDAAKENKDGVDTFIGPIFSYETAVLKMNLLTKNQLLFLVCHLICQTYPIILLFLDKTLEEIKFLV